jgi:hypothetical protein
MNINMGTLKHLQKRHRQNNYPILMCLKKNTPPKKECDALKILCIGDWN